MGGRVVKPGQAAEVTVKMAESWAPQADSTTGLGGPQTRMMYPTLPTLLLMVILAFAAAGCSNDDGGGGGTSPAATSGCDEVNTLKDSLTSLTQVDPVSDGTDALESAVAEVKTDLDAASSAVGADLEPAVDKVETAFGDLESALQGVSSAGSLGAAATEVGNALSELGTALTDLRSEIDQIC